MMASQPYRAIDVDGHFIEPDILWEKYLRAEFRSAAPRFALDSEGRRRVVLGNRTTPLIPTDKLKHSGPVRTGTPDGAGSDPVVRLEVMDAEGVDVMVMYPTRGLHFAFVPEKDACVALCQAYNNWAADFCSAAPDRLIAHAVVPQPWVHETRVEIERAVGDLGLKGVHMRPNSIGRDFDDPAWDVVWSTLEELDVPLGLHEGTGGYPEQIGVLQTDNYMFRHMMTHPYAHMFAMLSFIGAGIFDRHPNLRVAFVESGCGWVPYWLERLEHHVNEFISGDDLTLRPTEYFHRQCLVSTDADEGPVMSAFVHCLGPDNLAWSTDFPHPDHEWKGMVGQLLRRDDLSEVEKEKIIGGSAARFYRI
jgi:predicted TIM-barrel fold metal-dependent hydrolase